ncbi:MAG: hypothetical protein K2X81_17580 [Candidatus Obscuribacterales bacterium]|nr:hypothetical protein [Candidatus Obscuribacterales bacterium]
MKSKWRMTFAISCFSMSTIGLAAYADTTVTETTETIRSVPTDQVLIQGAVPTQSTVVREVLSPSSRVITLLPEHNYVLIDPLSGAISGVYDPATGFFDGKPAVRGMFVLDKITGKVIASVDDSGRYVDIATLPAASSFVVALDSRQADFSRKISDALTKGDITAARATALRARLDQIATAEAAARNSGGLLTYSEALALADSLNSVQEELLTFANVASVTPFAGGRIVVSQGNVLYVDDLDYRRLSLERRVDDEYRAGRLSAHQVAKLKEELDKIKTAETRYNKNGKIKPTQIAALSIRMDKMKTDLNKDIAYINSKRARIGIRVD